MGYYCRGTSRTLNMGVARAGWTAKRAAHVYTGKKKTDCNLWGITGPLNTSRPLAPPCSPAPDVDALRPAPCLQRSAQPPTRKLRLGIRACAVSCGSGRPREKGAGRPFTFFSPSVNACCALSRPTRPRHAHLQGPGGSAEVISQHPSVRPK